MAKTKKVTKPVSKSEAKRLEVVKKAVKTEKKAEVKETTRPNEWN